MRNGRTEIGIMVAVGLLAALLGPFGTYALPFGLRLLDWLLFALGGYLFFRPVIAGGEALAAHSRLPPALGIALACALAALPTTLLVAWALAGLRVARLTVGDLAALYPQVLLVGGAVTILQRALGRRARSEAHAPMPPSMPSPPPEPLPAREPMSPAEAAAVAVPPAEREAAFLARLPAHLGTDLLALENEDHYVRVHTPLGSALLLMRLRDAVAELAGVEGARVHRGWWVARAAVAEVVRRDRAIALRLVNGLEVPVARAEAPVLRQTGWF